MAANIEKTYEGQWSSDPVLLKSLLDAGETIIGLDPNCHPIELFSCDDEYWFETREDRYPLKHSFAGMVFLVPSPRPALEPKPLEWKPVYMNEVGGAEIVAIDGYWSFYAWDNGGWMISIDGTCVHDGASGTDLNNGTFDTARAAIHEWRVNHLKSMIQ